MKYLGSVLTAIQRGGGSDQNIRVLLTYVAFLLALVTFYSVAFHVLMAYEGRDHSWLTGFYWTLTVMSTLGFGDITFHSDLGRLFSVLVLVTGIVSLLVVLPFIFIEFFYVPFLKAQTRARAPRAISDRINGHVIMTSHDPVAVSLIGKLDNYAYPYVLIVDNAETALELVGEGFKVMVGALDDPQTYRNARVDQAALVVATGGDIINTNITFTVRELAPAVRIVASARDLDVVDILELAGSNRVLRPAEMLGTALARRTIAGDARAHVIGSFGELQIAEAAVAGTPLLGKTLEQSRLEQLAGIQVVGTWERGVFSIASAQTMLRENTVLVLAGTLQQVERYNALFCIYHVARGRVLILGAGRVGRATAQELALRGVEYCLVEKNREMVEETDYHIIGNATDRRVLDRAGLAEAPVVVVTTHDDDINIFLTIYCRRLRPDVQIICRATLERNVSTMHRAGADFVMSYANMGASAVFNYLERADILMLAEGLNVSRVNIPRSLAGKSLQEGQLQRETGCHLIAVGTEQGLTVNPDPGQVLPAHGSMVIVGDMQSEKRFLARYSQQ